MIAIGFHMRGNENATFCYRRRSWRSSLSGRQQGQALERTGNCVSETSVHFYVPGNPTNGRSSHTHRRIASTKLVERQRSQGMRLAASINQGVVTAYLIPRKLDASASPSMGARTLSFAAPTEGGEPARGTSCFTRHLTTPPSVRYPF